MIRRKGAISRAAIARETQLSATTVSALTTILLKSGFIHESGPGQSSGGRRPILLRFNYQFRHVLGVDIGATHITAVVMDLQGSVVTRNYCKFNVIDDPDGAIQTIVQLVHQSLHNAHLTSDRILGMCITIPTPLEGKNLDQITTVYMPAWKNRDILAEISQHFDLPIYIDNDANAGAIAEKWWGIGRSYANMAYIKLGLGVGSGLILNNEIFRGNGGTAGEIGHTTIDPTGPTCRCGNQGCLESFVSTRAIIDEVTHRRKKNQPHWSSSGAATIEEIISAALTGDPLSRSVIQTVGSYLGIATANLVNLFNPGLIVLGGELAAVGDLLVNEVRVVVQNRAMPKAAREVAITTSKLGEDAIVMGAATHAMRHAFQPGKLTQTLKS
ncbi:MAG: ROK family protein [Chloroflexi bacterium]|nr:ROK family protein [Chloroflexota bacterium]